VPARLRIGVTSAVESQWFQKVAQAMEAQGVEPVVTSDTSPRLVRQLSRGRLDAAFIALPTLAPGLEVAGARPAAWRAGRSPPCR
jgi:DNA-binding transcriptional LysR family regulator